MRLRIVLVLVAMMAVALVPSPASAATTNTISDEASCLSTPGAFEWAAPSICRIAQNWETGPGDAMVVDGGVELQMYARNLFWGTLVVRTGASVKIQPNGSLETWADTARIVIEPGATVVNHGSWLQFYGGDTQNRGHSTNGSFLGFCRLGGVGSVFDNYGTFTNEARQFVLADGQFNNFGGYVNTGSHSNAFLWMAGGSFVNRCAFLSYSSPGPILGGDTPTTEAPCDEDGDGVVDTRDMCPQTLELGSATTTELKKNRFAVNSAGVLADGHGTNSGYSLRYSWLRRASDHRKAFARAWSRQIWGDPRCS